VFQFRDYHGRWPPFSPPPFGLSIDTYARLQRSLSLPFGVALMLLLTAALVVYLRRLRRGTAFIPTLNTLGTTFFLPFLLVQPIDQLIIALVGWRRLPVAELHTAVLAWESWAAARIVSVVHGLSWIQCLGGVVLLCGIWIVIAGVGWR